MPSEKIQKTLDWLDDHGITYEVQYLISYECHKELRTAEKVSFHPCDNTASVVLTHDMFEYEWLEI